ncbi:MAG: HAMP domain-containing histidine kinase [Myxococcales bacterium]|nr:HAMP domain-containing histidine kinase [Myxococcales bacterium]
MMVRASVAASAGTVTILTAVLLFLLHRHVHTQTDTLLLHLAVSEAADLAREFSSKGAHVHTDRVTLPMLDTEAAERHALVFDSTCRVLAKTPKIVVDVVPTAWCAGPPSSGDHRHLDAEGIAAESLRGATFSLVIGDEGEILTLFVGVSHEAIDSSLWSVVPMAVVLAVLAVAVIAGVLAFVSGRVTRDLDQLAEACAQSGEGSSIDPGPGRPFVVSDDAPEELGTLARTLSALLERVNGLLQSQARFVAEAAHELRTPVTALQGELEVTLRRPRSADEYREAIEEALADTRRLVGLSEQLLTAARAHTEPLPVAPIPLRAVLDESLARFASPFRSHGIEVIFGDQGRRSADVRVKAHALSTGRVMDNLLQNVIQHAAATELTLTVACTASDVRVRIADNGRGVRPDVESGLFTPFHHSTETGGHGLGLTISRDLMRRQGGDLDFEPVESGGSAWTLTFARAG